MLSQFRTKHVKPIIWIILIAVASCFILWGTPSSKKENFGLLIGKKRITKASFTDHITTAKLHYRFSIGEDFYDKVNDKQLEAKSFEMLTFLWKAEKEDITVSDQEVMKTIQTIFSQDGLFNKEAYLYFTQENLRLSPRKFEEHIRRILIIDKVVDKYIRSGIEVEESQIRNLYKKNNEKIKISYTLIPYERFAKNIIISDEKINEFYNKSIDRFKEPKKIKISYINILNENNRKLISKLKKSLKKTETIQDLAKEFSLTLEESNYLTSFSSLPGGFWNKKLSDMAFSLPVNKLSPIIEFESNIIIFQKTEEIEEKILMIEEVRDIISKELEREEKQKLAKDLAREILNTITTKKIKDLEKISSKYELATTSSEYLLVSDSIEGIGRLDRIAAEIKNIEKGQILKKSLSVLTGECIVKLVDLTSIDEVKYEKEKESYKAKIWEQKALMKHFTFLTELQKEANVKSLPQSESNT